MIRPNSPLPEKTRVFIVEDQIAIREMLASFVDAISGFACVGQAGSVPEALMSAGKSDPHVVVLDWMLLGGTGLDFLKQVHSGPRPYVLVFSANTSSIAVREALGAGARGYIEKTASFAEFKKALLAIAAGQTFLGPAIGLVVQRLVANPQSLEANMMLSSRERDVLRFVAEGLSSKEIAEVLHLSVRTVENHRASICRRTGLRSVAQLTLHAVRLGLVDPPASGQIPQMS